jgi:beta-lactamase class C
MTKDNATRCPRFRWPWFAALLSLPLALGSAAQTPLRWQQAPVSPSPPGPSTPSPPTQGPATQSPAALPATAVTALPPATGFDVRQFEAIAEKLVAHQRVPGLAMALVQNGRVLSARGYGTTDVRIGEPVDAHTVFRLASLSKGFAGTMTGLLVSDGTLRWDSRLTDFVPGFRLKDPSAARRVTIADLLSHRVGLTHNTYDRDLERNVEYHTLTQRLAQAPMACQPGDCFGYQNIAFSLIGDVVLAATGHDYRQTVERRLFAPLGMRDASLGLDGIAASTNWARPHVRGRRGWVSLLPKPTYYRVLPAAGVNASIHDMAQWLLAQGGHRPDVLPAPLLATLHAPVVTTPGETRGSPWRRARVTSASYALGWRVYDYAGHPLVFHGGAVQGYRGMIAMLPEHDLGVAILWNSESTLPSGLLPTILDRVLDLPTQRWVDVDVGSEPASAEHGAAAGTGVATTASR